MRLCVLVNPQAGSASQLAVLRQALARERKVRFIEPAPGEDLAELAANVARGRCDVIGVAGGDGTVHRVVSGLAPHFPHAPLAVFPLGTGNDLCRTLAVPLDPAEAARLLHSARRRKIDVIRVEGRGTIYAANVVTGGFSGRVAADMTPEMKGFWGPLAYLRGAAGATAGEGYRATFRFDGGAPETLDVLNVVIANGRTAGGGVPVAPRANPEDGLLDVVIVPAGDLLDLSVVAARLMAGDYAADELVVHRRAARVELASDPPIPLSIDGELAEGDRFTFTAVPKALRVLAGPDYRPDPQGPPPEADDWDADRGGRGLGHRLFGLVAALLVLLLRMPRGYALGLATAAAAALGFAALADLVLTGRMAEVNESIRAAMRARASPDLDSFALALTRFGEWWATSAVGALLVLWYASRRRYLDAATMFLIVAGCGLLELLLKGLFEVARPDPTLFRVPARGFSFPSGHAIRSVGLYGGWAALLVAHRARAWWRWLVAAGCVLLALGVCWTRPYLLVHWPTDVLAGALAALAWVSACLVARHHAHLRMARRDPRR